jgi:uncharacterized lipoprotein YmbA
MRQHHQPQRTCWSCVVSASPSTFRPTRCDTVWAERLELGLTDHLVMRLRMALPGWTVCERSCPAQASSTTLNVDFAPLDHVRAEGVLRAQAHWLLTGKEANAPGTTTDTVAVRPDSPEGQAMALAEVLDHLAGDIAATLQSRP